MSSSFGNSDFIQRLAGVRDLKKILETTVKEFGEIFGAECCQVMLSNPLDPNVTSICEYRSSPEEDAYGLPGITMPLVLHGRTFGSLSLSRRSDVSQDEVNAIRVILGELGDIIRHAQINDIVQRDTFRDTFLVEIGNVMSYSLGIGDALFMVVNILGKVLQASRCLFICTDDQQAGWKCYEFWQQEKVQSCQEYRWPTTDSALIAQTLLSTSPLSIFEGQQNSYVMPVQEELQFIGVKSTLGIALRSSTATHGCVILQQCDYRRAWTRNEVDMVQNVADKVADALVKLPAEKRAREPIMQLHQRTIAVPDATPPEGKASYDSVRKALKGALGQQAIPSARSKPAAPAAPPAPQPSPTATLTTNAATAPQPPALKPVAPAASITQQNFAPAAKAEAGPTISPVQSRGAAPQAPADAAGGKSLGSILTTPAQTPAAPAAAATEAVQAKAGDPYADLDFGEMGEPSEPGKPRKPRQEREMDPDSTWGNLDAIQPAAGQALQPQMTPAPAAVQERSSGQFDTLPPGAVQPSPVTVAASVVAAPVAPAPAAAATAAPGGASPWGDLDAIATPTAGPAKAGLGGAIFGKARAPVAAASSAAAGGGSGLGNSFYKGKHGAAQVAEASPEFVEGPPAEIDDAAAAAKIQQLMASSTTETSDYIFATPGLDMRMLGRIDGWISQIESKDKYANGHARQVAEYATAIAQQSGLSAEDVDMVRQAALVHDVGKLGSAPQILQKPDEQLSDPELITVMKHPLSGAELLESFPDLQRLAPIVRAHHEEYDGNGYPQGLKGEEIPVAARIIHVANSYHGMTSQMRYGAGMKPSDAQQELVKGAGKQWDPNFVQMLILAIMSNKVPAVF